MHSVIPSQNDSPVQMRCAHALRSVAHYRCDVLGGYGAWHITGSREREPLGSPKIFPPTSLGHFFFMAAQLIICSTKFYPWHGEDTEQKN